MLATDLKSQARRLALRAAKVTTAALLGLAGTGFLVAAAWQAVADALSPIEANAILGVAFVAAGMAVLCWPQKKPRTPQIEVGATDLLQVFMSGLNTGRSLR